MARDVTFTVDIDYNNCQSYLTADGVSLHINLFGTELAVRHYLNSGTSGYATINADAMSLLFPTTTAIPHQMDWAGHIGQLTSNSNNYVELQVDGTTVKKYAGDAGAVSDSFTGETIEGLRQSGSIRTHHHSRATTTGTSTRYFNTTLYFWQYDFLAQTAGNGVSSASVDNIAPYEGDSVTFVATLKSGATWHGWYSDAEHTQLVSTEQSYTVTASADTTLYAYATREGGTGLYLKNDGAFAEAQDIYKKVNGVWVLQTTDDYKTLLQSGNWRKG